MGIGAIVGGFAGKKAQQAIQGEQTPEQKQDDEERRGGR